MLNDPTVVCLLLRAIANATEAKVNGHDVILLAAAELIEQYKRDAARCHLSNPAEA